MEERKERKKGKGHTGTDLGKILTDFLNELQRHKLLGGLGAGSPRKGFGFFISIFNFLSQLR